MLDAQRISHNTLSTEALCNVMKRIKTANERTLWVLRIISRLFETSNKLLSFVLCASVRMSVKMKRGSKCQGAKMKENRCVCPGMAGRDLAVLCKSVERLGAVSITAANMNTTCTKK